MARLNRPNRLDCSLGKLETVLVYSQINNVRAIGCSCVALRSDELKIATDTR